jgi:hypothetical protein
MHSARDPTSRLETSPLRMRESLNKNTSNGDLLNQSNLFSQVDEVSFILNPFASDELLCGCECEKFTSNARYCTNAKKWLERFYKSDFDYIIYQKTYEGFLQSSP